MAVACHWVKPAWTCDRCRKIQKDKDLGYEPPSCNTCRKIPRLMPGNAEAFHLFQAALAGVYSGHGIDYRTIETVMNNCCTPQDRRQELTGKIVAAATAVWPLLVKKNR